MARQICDIKGLTKLLPFSTHQIYKLVRNPTHPLPFKKAGRRLLFDVEKVYRWFDSLPGKDHTVNFLEE
jgi:hypothetical protein